ncbi:MAG: hypothetical protein RL111_2092 [Pseudomonadota bacterium]|jgi:chromosome partitioning protein
MKIVVVMNPKGGVGKSTLSTQIAGYYANQGHGVILGDADVQESAKNWLRVRPATVARIQTWDLPADLAISATAPQGVSHVVIDTAGSVHGWRMERLIERAHKIVIPVQPSTFDMQATRAFFIQLREHFGRNDHMLGAVGMRVVPRTISARHLEAFMTELHIPVRGMLRDTQNYVQFAAHGLSFFDVTAARYAQDLDQWKPICHWLDH